MNYKCIHSTQQLCHITQTPLRRGFFFAVFHQQILDVGFTLNPSLHHLVKRPLGLYLVLESRFLLCLSSISVKMGVLAV